MINVMQATRPPADTEKMIRMQSATRMALTFPVVAGWASLWWLSVVIFLALLKFVGLETVVDAAWVAMSFVRREGRWWSQGMVFPEQFGIREWWVGKPGVEDEEYLFYIPQSDKLWGLNRRSQSLLNSFRTAKWRLALSNSAPVDHTRDLSLPYELHKAFIESVDMHIGDGLVGTATSRSSIFQESTFAFRLRSSTTRQSNCCSSCYFDQSVVRVRSMSGHYLRLIVSYLFVVHIRRT